MNKLILWMATGFGVGYARKAPGTFGTLLGTPLVFALHQLGDFGFLIATMVLVIASCFIAEKARIILGGTEDNQKIVIDEIMGFVVTMTWLPLTWQAIALSFLIFRILDVAKPGPIGYIDRKLGGGVGIVMDDVAAGIVGNIILQIIYTKTSWLGLQLYL